MSQESEYTEGDLRNTGMSLKHDREWDYELEEIVEAIEERDAKKVGLQFPEGLKRRGPAVADDLRALADDDVTFMLSGQPCYGACDLDTYLMKRTDVFVHFGHSPMKDTDKVIYVPLFSNVEVTPIMEESLDTLEPPEETEGVGLVTTAQHMNRYEEMTAFLEERGYEVQSRRGDERLTNEGQVLGCNYASADVPAEQVLYVGGGKFHPLGLAMEHPDKHVVIADPVNNVVTVADTDKFLKQRYGAVHRAMDAEKWGVIFCTKIGQGRWEIAQDIIDDNDNAYLITMDEVTPDRLQNFDMDAFVNTGCPRITTDDGPQFHKPMLTPGEYRIAVGDEPLDSLSFDTFHGTW
ncbi:diphthamide biosynthesis enzyme Dph2 [Natrinema sp. CBA1119]|uniref:diphthamide biosynthesis enzyme Dph2 n=1 Tax=unclassified Natrinema TaxID=2622230 RepID=UPI000BFA60F5|nr:diphthamide biosynthesis enzyme Dph2 [Natrinema sp. CBA1119]PGF18082.1 diphthamide biosynthesis enzyme Dph2 [Natrinema sp. CBA1119]